MQYDSYKVQAVLNEIDGYDHSRTTKVGVPAIFGMNFQTVSTAEKLLKSDGLNGGYLPGTTTPGPLLQRALDYINAKLEAMDNEIHAQGLADSTAIIVSAKHGQSPQDPNSLTRIKDGPIIEAINAAWEEAHPGAGALIVAGTDDDAWQSYLSDTSQQAADFVKDYLWSHPATGVAYDGSSRTLAHSGLAKIYAGKAAARYFGVPSSDPRHPDVWGVVQVGVVYTGGTKIAEHGGANPADRNVPIVVYAPGPCSPGCIGRGWRPRRSPRRSSTCSASTRTRSKRFRSRAHARFRASPATDQAPRSKRAGVNRGRPFSVGWAKDVTTVSPRITRRGIQIALGLIWLLDGILQFQSYMYSREFIPETIEPMLSMQPAWLAHSIHWAGHSPARTRRSGTRSLR